MVRQIYPITTKLHRLQTLPRGGPHNIGRSWPSVQLSDLFYCGRFVAPTTTGCCFNHILGLPRKDDEPKPLYDYEVDLFSALDQHKYVWIKKARGLGITEFMLRYILFRTFTDIKFRNSQIGIVTGPAIDISIDLVRRLKRLLRNVGVTREDKETAIRLDHNIVIQAFPSNHVSAFRGFTNVKFIFLDEADFFRTAQQDEVLDVSHGYIPKSDPQIVMVSTPNNPGGLFYRIENDLESRYHKVYLPYTAGIGKIYEDKDIEEARHFPSFEREYNLQYGFGQGNVFRQDQIDFCTFPANNKTPPDQLAAIASSVSIGIDPGFGSSKFAICAMANIDARLHVLETVEFERADIHYMTDVCFEMINKYEATKVFIDASAPGLIKDIKIAVRENPEYEKEIVKAKKEKVAIGEKMRIIPVNFATDGRGMLMFMMSLVSSDMVRINPRFAKLIQQMRIAKVQATTGKLDKSAGNTMDSLDACMLAAWLWKFQ